jgi:hypothetical protein
MPHKFIGNSLLSVCIEGVKWTEGRKAAQIETTTSLYRNGELAKWQFSLLLDKRESL